MRIAVIGLGYVGLPVAVAFARAFPGVVGYDISKIRVEALRAGVDATGEIAGEELNASTLKISGDEHDLAGVTFFVVTVPTPIDAHRRPDLSPLESACRLIGPHLRAGAIIVFESTVYPGVTEDFCGPLLEKFSGLRRGVDFKLGYSPERINPGDKEHRFETITKVVAGQDARTLDICADVYGSVVTAGIHRASSICCVYPSTPTVSVCERRFA